MIPLFHLGRDCLINNNDKIKKFLKQIALLFFVFANAGKFPRPSKSQQTCIGNYWRGESFINAWIFFNFIWNIHLRVSGFFAMYKSSEK